MATETAIDVVMPQMGVSVSEGTVTRWLKQEGERVTKGEPLLEIETDKAVVEVEAPADGILAGIKAAAGADIPVGQIIAWIVAPGEEPPAESESTTPTARAGAHAKVEPSQVAATPAGISSAPIQCTASAYRFPTDRSDATTSVNSNHG